jgi:hypothetical protein
MRINELLIESLNEAISISHFEPLFKQAIRTGIKHAVAGLYKLKGTYPKLEAKFNNGHTSDLLRQLLAVLTGPTPELNMGTHVSSAIIKELTKQLGNNTVRELRFTDTGNAYGLADDDKIEIAENIIKRIAKQTLINLIQIVLDNYGEGQLTGGLWFIVNSIARNERDYIDFLFNHNETSIAKVSSTIVHEVVHVIQHNTQRNRGFTNYEYRSYLDKKKGEFVDLHRQRMLHPDQIDSDTENKYFKLYMASPQEIASFSHEIAIAMINDYDFPDASTVADLNNLVSVIDAEGIVDYVKGKVGKYFRNPQNAREYAVFKRYVKLVYQEIYRYVAYRKNQLMKK